MIETIAPESGLTTVPQEAKSFMSQFKNLDVDARSKIIPVEHDFYSGDEPIWPDILREYDVNFDWTEDVARELIAPAKETNKQVVYYIPGDQGTGKTALLFRSGYMM